MKYFRRDSLVLRLAWRLCLLQCAIVFVAMIALAYRFFDGNTSYIDAGTMAAFSSATRLSDTGPVFKDTAALRDLLRKHQGAWAVAVDEQGRYAYLRHVPAAYQPLVAQLPSIGASEVHPLKGSKGLDMRTIIESRAGGMLHLMIGGVPTVGYSSIIVSILRGLSPFFVYPLIFLTLIAVPWVIVRATGGVRRVAEQASGMDLTKGGASLDELAVPHEIRPLVGAFNVAMEGVREGYQARDRFLRDAAHELRMPIAILASRIEAMPSAPVRYQLLTEVARLANIAEQLLDLERLRTPKPDLVPVDLVELVREVTSDIAPLAIARGYELCFDAPDEPVMVTGHASSLSRVAANLLQNAIVHGGSGLIEVTVGASGWFEVRDHGAGVSAQDKSRIFQPFYRAQAACEGYGLGLHLAQEIIERHGGRIRVTDTPGGGANFRVVIKLSP